MYRHCSYAVARYQLLSLCVCLWETKSICDGEIPKRQPTGSVEASGLQKSIVCRLIRRCCHSLMAYLKRLRPERALLKTDGSLNRVC